MRYVLYCESWGVYLGEFMGLGFWSKLDPCEQPSAVTFGSDKEAMDYVATWDERPDDALVTVLVTPSDGLYATSADWVVAGLPGWDDAPHGLHIQES